MMARKLLPFEGGGYFVKPNVVVKLEDLFFGTS